MRNDKVMVEAFFLQKEGRQILTKNDVFLLFKKGLIPNSIDEEKAFTWLLNNNLELLNNITREASNYELDQFLIKAVYINDVKGAQYLISRGADASCDYDICLCVAAYLGYDEMVQILVKAGANVNAEDGYPIQVASERGYEEIFEFLKKNGAKMP